MKLVSKSGVELDVKKYAMPTKGAAGSAKVNGEDVTTMYTAGRGKDYTYFRLSNVDLYVAGALDAEQEYTIELPEGFGAEQEPAPRKSYYVRKRGKNVDGSVAMGSSDATDAPHTEVRDGKEVAVNPDGSLVDEALQAQALEEGNAAGSNNAATTGDDDLQDSTQHGGVQGGDGTPPADTDPEGNPIDEDASTKEAAKKRGGKGKK